MAPSPPGGALRPSLVALVPVALLAAVCLVVVAVAPDARVVGLVAVAVGSLVAVACALVLAAGWRRRLEGLARAAGAADAALDEAARALAEGRAVEVPPDVSAEGREAASGGAADRGRVEGAVGGTDAVAVTAATIGRLVGTSTRLLAEESRRRRAIADLFVNVGRRNQNLVSRQLKLLDRLEETETDPEALAALFRLDHLSTRMRRNAESLLVVAGLEPPRRWRQPVPIREVARAAAAESEEFERVELGTFPVIALSGDVVATIVHLLAELIDNGVRFSPPDTSVTVRAAVDGDDLAVVIADSGVGMAPAAVAQANAQLAAGEPERSDIPAAELGLYVVGRLAARAGIDVRLESAGGDGVSATVCIRPRLLEAVPTSAVASSTPEDARRTVAAAERAANGSSSRRSTTAPARRLTNGAHRVEARAAGTAERQRPVRPDAPAQSTAQPPATGPELTRGRDDDGDGSAETGENGSSGADRTANGFRRRQPKAGAPERERRGPSRLRAPDPSSAAERRDRLERFSAGKATAEEVMSLRDTSGDTSRDSSREAGPETSRQTDAGDEVDGAAGSVPRDAAGRDSNGSRGNGARGDVGGEAG